MAEAIQFMFEHQEVVELLVKKQGLHEGLWMISIEFGQTAVTIPTGPDGQILKPAALNIVQRIGLKKHAGEPTNLTVDAAEVNPLYKQAGKGAKKAGSKKKAVKK